MQLSFFLVAFSCLVYTAFGYGSGISSTVFSLPAYQTDNGGFSTNVMDEAPGTLDDTAHAAFLASLFGVKDKLNVEHAQQFIQSVQNPDGGFSNEPGRTSDLESTRNALAASQQLGSLPADTSKTVSFVNNLYDSNAKLFKNSAGRSADLKATARALQIFQLLEYDTEELKARKAEIAAHLSSSIKTEEGRSFFSSITADNYYGVVVADLTGLELTDVESWTAYFLSRQVNTGPKKGGFYSDDFATEVEVYDAEHAIHALYILGGHVPVPRSAVNVQALQGYLNSLAPALNSAAQAYAALGRTVAFTDGFKVAPSFAVRDAKYKVVGNRIIQGSHFRANAALRTTYGLSHSGASGQVVISYQDVVKTAALSYNAGTQLYESQESYDSTGQFGDISMHYTLNWRVPGFEEITISFSEKKSIGYDLSVASKASYGDDEMDPEETVGIGAAFEFTVQLGTVGIPKPKLLDGEFDVILTVLDSSNIAIHTDSFDARGNTNAIVFKYDLSSANLPSGRITFRFQVKGTTGVHTTEEIWFNFNVPMVATAIEFEQDQELHFNDKIKISMTPASFYNSDTHTYDKVGSRRFYLDVHSAGGNLLGSFPGNLQVTSEGSVYNFDVNIQPRFDWIGTHVVTFRYQDAYGNDFSLKNYNSEENQLFDEDLTYVVDSSLDIVEITELPTGGELAYGTEVTFNFQVKDTWSEELVNRGAYDATAFLAIRHEPKGGKAFTSSKVRAQNERDASGQYIFTINWEVDPNAVKEEGRLVLFVLDADNNEVPLSINGEAWSVPVTIGGSLNIEQRGYSAIYDDTESIFFVSFELSSDDKKLSGAELNAKVSFENSVISVLPVSAGLEGEYQVSWTLNHQRAKSGSYVVDVFRRVDLDRATSENPYDTAKPFFSVTVNHEGVSVSPLPFKTEFLFLLGAIVVVFVVTVKKLEIDKKN